MKPLNPPCRCLSQAAGVMDRTVEVSSLEQGCDRGMQGAFHISFYVLFRKQESRASHAKGLEQRCMKSSARSSQPPSLGLFFPSLGLSLSQSFTPLSHSFLVFLIQPVSALPSQRCHLIPIPAGKPHKLAKLEIVQLLSLGFWMGKTIKGCKKIMFHSLIF